MSQKLMLIMSMMTILKEQKEPEVKREKVLSLNKATQKLKKN